MPGLGGFRETNLHDSGECIKHIQDSGHSHSLLRFAMKHKALLPRLLRFSFHNLLRKTKQEEVAIKIIIL